MQNVVQVLEKQYLEEKRTALEEQRLMYERELESLRQQLSPEKTPQHHRSSSDRLTFPTHTPHGKLRLWTEERSVEHRHTHGYTNVHILRCVYLCKQGLEKRRNAVIFKLCCVISSCYQIQFSDYTALNRDA